MKIEELHWWEFDKEPEMGCEIQCPECLTWHPHEEWHKGLVGCELCGDHDALVCPACGEHFDHVKGPIFKIKN